MSYYLRLMQKKDVSQVTDIDREVFPTMWPPPDYQHEIQEQTSRYIVACDPATPVPGAEAKADAGKGRTGLTAIISRWFRREPDVSSEAAVATPPEYVLGFAGVWLMADEAHLTNIAVRTRFQHQGIGEMLLIGVFDMALALKANVVTLEVRVSNTVAQNLYTKYSFVKVGLRRGYYTDNREDAILMSTNSFTSAAFQERFQQLRQAHALRWGIGSYRLANGQAQPDKR